MMPTVIIVISSLPIIIPLLLLLFYFDKSSKKYRIGWCWLVSILMIVCVATFIYVMCVPYYSQTSHHTANPGGPSGNILWGMLFLLFVASVVTPSFPTLFLLGLFPPKSYSHKKRLVIRMILPIIVVILASLIFIKYGAYMKDYHEYRKGPRQTSFERFEHLRKDQVGFLYHENIGTT